MDEIKIKSYFEIPPTAEGRCVFKGVAFNINDIRMVDEPAQGNSVLDYRFRVYIGTVDEYKLEFCFKRMKDAKSANSELVRAWARVGEFNDVKRMGD